MESTNLMLFSFLGILLLSGTSIFICLALSVLLFLKFYTPIPVMGIIERQFAGLDRFAMMCVPFFILAANVAGVGGISRRIINLSKVLVGHFKGGLAMTTVLACTFFGAISGSAPATVIAIGKILYPALIETGYGKKFSLGVITSSGAIALIIPPSITMIVLGAVCGMSIGALFVSGFGAGITIALVFMLYCYLYARRRDIKLSPRANLREIWAAGWDAKWALGVPLIIIGGIYGGVFTPTEASGVAAAYTLFIAQFIHREAGSREIFKAVVDSATVSAQIMIILAAASVFSWAVTTNQLSRSIANWVMGISSSPYMVLVLINLVFLIAGCLVDSVSSSIILGPMLYPLVTGAGIDPIHFGIITTVNLSIGMFTPPFGLNLFVATVVPQEGANISMIIRGVGVFIAISMIALAIVTYVPGVSLWLPRTLGMMK
jgi:C4-dicarboxylate transporter DctM subunit